MTPSAPQGPSSEVPDSTNKRTQDRPTHVSAVGSSAGGLSAMINLFANMHDGTMSFVVLQHLPPSYKSELVDILRKKTSLSVEEAQDGAQPRINTIHVVPADSLIQFTGNTMVLHKRDLDDGVHLSIDACLKSLAHELGSKAVGVLLSGTGRDGALGLRDIRANGGHAFVQSPAEAECPDMPQHALDEAGADFCLPVDQLARELAFLGQSPKQAEAPKLTRPSQQEADEINDIILLHCKIHLEDYKRSTLERRLERRMGVVGAESVARYLDIIRADPDETALLAKGVFINVTRFFRDTEIFKYLQSETLPRLLRESSNAEGLRIWCLGCSTGEEAYSLAISLHLVMEKLGIEVPIKIIASDVDPQAIAVARKGIYNRHIIGDMPQKTLSRFFTFHRGKFQAKVFLRKNILFSHHDALNDPPFSNIDLVCCRNLLIYFQPLAQQRCLQSIHYALRSLGTLVLGSSESTSETPDLFANDEREFNIYRKCAVLRGSDSSLYEPARGVLPTRRTSSSAVTIKDIRRDAELAILRNLGEPGVIVKRDMTVLEIRGDAREYLNLSSGNARFNLLRFTPVGMHRALEEAMKAAAATPDGKSIAQVECLIGGSLRSVILSTLAIMHTAPDGPLFLILFSDAIPISLNERSSTSQNQPDEVSNNRVDYIRALETELHIYKERMHQAIDDKEFSLEETRQIGQEAQANQEEMRSFIEELETSREEIRSSSEELGVVNEELRVLMTELEVAHDELQDFLKHAESCLIYVDLQYCIGRFSDFAAKLFDLDSSDRGRSLSYMNSYFEKTDLPYIVMQCLEHNKQRLELVKHIDGYALQLHVKPVASKANGRVTGCFLIFSAFGTSELQKEMEPAPLHQQFEHNWLFSSYGMAIVSDDLVGVWANLVFHHLTQITREAFMGRPLSQKTMEHCFSEEFLRVLADFVASDQDVLRSDALQFDTKTSARLRAIGVHKIPRSIGKPGLLRVTFEETSHD